MGITKVPIWLSRHLNASGETVLRACFTRFHTGDHCTRGSDAFKCNSPARHLSSAAYCWCPGSQLSKMPASGTRSAVPYVVWGTAADLREILSICGQSPESALWSWGQRVNAKKEKCRSNSALSHATGPLLLSEEKPNAAGSRGHISICKTTFPSC